MLASPFRPYITWRRVEEAAEAGVEKDLIRTCSAAEAAILAAAAGRCARVGSACVCVHPPAGAAPIDPDSSHRYLARVELVGNGIDREPAASPDVDRVLSDLFGPYLA
jgi:hypothetical protein